MSELLPPCTNACPVRTDVRGYIAAIARRDYAEACRLIRARNPFPSVCAWVCPHPCEEACRRAGVDMPLSIRELKRFAVENAAWSPAVPAPATGKKVAVVGAGPAGLTAAYELVLRGHRAVVYERHRSPGGHFFTSLPAYRLPREVLQRDLETILAAGVEVRTGVEVGRDVTVTRLRDEYDAVIIGVGLRASKRLDVPGGGLPGVYPALEFLEMANLGERPRVSGRVAVVGGGDVAMDAARTALRLGASEVLVICLEEREQMPAHRWEVDEALAEGVTLLPGRGPAGIMEQGGRVVGLKVQKVKSVFDPDGRFNPVYEPGSFESVPCDTVITAIGQAPDFRFLNGSGLKAGEGGRLVLDGEFFVAGVRGLFACGEIAAGPGPAIAAVASGRRAAELVDRYLKGAKGLPPEDEGAVIGPLPAKVAGRIPRRARREAAGPPGGKAGVLLVPRPVPAEPDALYEAGRCLSCGLGARVDGAKCAACLACLRVCPYGVPVAGRQAVMPVEGCLACGICASVCPAGAIAVEKVDMAAGPHLPLDGRLAGKVAVFTCLGACEERLELDALKKNGGQPGLHVIEMPAAGALRLEWILNAFENGAAGAAVIACGAGECCHPGGTAYAQGVVARARSILEQAGVAPERLCCLRPDGERDAASLLAGFIEGLK
ncbi:MAG: FAD-dependent oxidoreductase [Pelotomaculum sp.]|nr:FAD-dependent oxidoreductase [Pelotomaculum sp.]